MRVRIIIALVALQISPVLKVMRFALNHAGRRMDPPRLPHDFHVQQKIEHRTSWLGYRCLCVAD